MGCHFILQEIFPTQGLNPGLPHCRLYRFTVWATREVLRHDGKVRVTIHFSAPVITTPPSGLTHRSSGKPSLESRPIAPRQCSHVALDYPIIYTVLQLFTGLDFPISKRVLRRQILCISCPSFISGVCHEQSLKWLWNEGQNKWMSRRMNTCSVAQASPTLWDPMDCSTPGFPVLCHLLEFAQTHVHWVSDAIQPSCPLPFSSPPTFNLSQHEGLFQWVRIRWPVIRASASAPLLSTCMWNCRC